MRWQVVINDVISVLLQVGSVNFDPAYKDAEKPVVEFAFANNITGFRCHDNIFSQQASASDEVCCYKYYY